MHGQASSRSSGTRTAKWMLAPKQPLRRSDNAPGGVGARRSAVDRLLVAVRASIRAMTRWLTHAPRQAHALTHAQQRIGDQGTGYAAVRTSTLSTAVLFEYANTCYKVQYIMATTCRSS